MLEYNFLNLNKNWKQFLQKSCFSYSAFFFMFIYDFEFLNYFFIKIFFSYAS